MNKEGNFGSNATSTFESGDVNNWNENSIINRNPQDHIASGSDTHNNIIGSVNNSSFGDNNNRGNNSGNVSNRGSGNDSGNDSGNNNNVSVSGNDSGSNNGVRSSKLLYGLNNIRTFLSTNKIFITMIVLFCVFASIAVALSIDVLINRSYHKVLCIMINEGQSTGSNEESSDTIPVYYAEYQNQYQRGNQTNIFSCWIDRNGNIKLYEPLPYVVKIFAVMFWVLALMILPIYTVLFAMNVKNKRLHPELIDRHPEDHSNDEHHSTVKSTEMSSYYNQQQGQTDDSAAEFVIE